MALEELPHLLPGCCSDRETLVPQDVHSKATAWASSQLDRGFLPPAKLPSAVSFFATFLFRCYT